MIPIPKVALGTKRIVMPLGPDPVTSPPPASVNDTLTNGARTESDE
jgi:hypothetical protein